MRQFWLTSDSTSDNNRFELTSQTCLLHDVSNLGYTYDYITREVGNRLVLVNKKLKKQTITGTIAFMGVDDGINMLSPYDQFFTFVDYARKYGILYLHYFTDHDLSSQFIPNYFQRKVVISKIEKGEINRLGYLDCSVTFTCLEPWAKTSNHSWPEYGPVPIEGDGWVWGLNWGTGVTWNYDIADKMSILIRDPSQESIHITSIDSPCELRIYGPITNPSWTHHHNGTLVMTGSVACEVPSGYWLSVNSLDGNYDLSLYTKDSSGNVVKASDVYQQSNFYKGTFLTMKDGENIIHVDGTGMNFNTRMELDVRWYFDAV